ncbi:unnamed protein product [Ilex paraguariensis]|uniref:Uncharacterized protein n=1 Tax=Ilex paraguariensis TaxID=185542 RepID=A0ABC8T0Z7_9AQUA
MALTARILLPIRSSFSSIASPYSLLYHSRLPFYGRLEPLKTWIKFLEPVLRTRAPTSHWIRRLYLPTFQYRRPNLYNSGLEFGMRTIFGVSFLVGSISLWPRVAYAMDGFDIWGDNHRDDLLAASGSEEDPHTILTFARKLFVPVFLFATVFMNWGHPIILAAKVILILLGTKPSPFSVYLFIEQLRHEVLRQHPFLYKFKVSVMPLFFL